MAIGIDPLVDFACKKLLGSPVQSVPVIHLDFRLRCAAHGLTLTDQLQIHTLQLPKHRLPSDNERITDPIEEWCCFLLASENVTPDEITFRLSDPVFSEAIGI